MEAHQLLIARQGQSRIVACLRRGLDIVLAATALLLLSPVVAVVAFAIAVSSPGPVVFRQRRLGRDLNPFTVLKFRTMHANADSAPHRDYVRTLIDSQDDGRQPGRALQARRRRPRHRARPHAAQVEPGRAAPAVERHPRRHGARRAAPRHPLRGGALPARLPRVASPSSRASPGSGRSAAATNGPTRKWSGWTSSTPSATASASTCSSSPRRCGLYSHRKGAA